MTQDPNYASPPPGDDPQTKVNLPGILLMVVGGLYMGLAVVGLLMNLLGMGMGAAAGRGGGQAMFSGAVGVFGAIFGLCLGGVILFGGLKLKSLKSYPMAMAGCIAAMLPCSICCIAGLPIGIWALVVIMKPDVKAAFTA